MGWMKRKLGAVFPLVQADLALRRALAVAVLDNLKRRALLWRLFWGFAMPRRIADCSNSPPTRV